MTARRAPGDPVFGDAPGFLNYNSTTGEFADDKYHKSTDRRRRSPHHPRPRTQPEAMPVDHWDDNPNSWDVVMLDGVPLPGVCDVDATVARKVDAKSASGADGGTVRDKGYDLAKFKVTVHYWTKDHLALQVQLAPLIDPRKRGSERRPTVILHPALYMVGITRAYITGVSAPKLSSRIKGGREQTITFIEYNPATPSTRSVTRTPGSGSNGAPAQVDAFSQSTTAERVANGKAAAVPTPPSPATDTGP